MSRVAHGLRAWLIQRVSAVYLALFGVYLVVHFMGHPAPTYAQWQAWVSQPLVAVGIVLFFLAVLVHAWVGARDVILDYVHIYALRLLLLSGLMLVLIGCGIWLVRTVLVLEAT